MKVTQIALMLGLVAILFYSFAQAENTIDDTAINAKPIETFNPPTRIKTKTPKFPVMRQKQGKEGWAEVNFMVDTAGKPYDITVVGGTGDNLFEKATIRAVKQFLYEPAVFQG